MGSITIDGVSEGLAQRLRTRARAKGHTLEQTALEILNGAMPGSDEARPDYPGSAKEVLAQIRAIVEPLGGIELDIPPRGCCEHVCSGRQPL